MSDSYFQLRKIAFSSQHQASDLTFRAGVNVICGASDTGKSFLAEAIDYMLGGKELREVPELEGYAEIQLDLVASGSDDELTSYRLKRSVAGGNFSFTDLNDISASPTVLSQKHAHGKIDNLSGLLLSKLGLSGRRVLKSSKKGTTQSLSFRNIAPFIIVQEDEIQRRSSPFWGGQFTTKTAELATAKLMLTGIDDSSVVSSPDEGTDPTKQINLLNELISDILSDIEDAHIDRNDLADQLSRLEESIFAGHSSVSTSQVQLENLTRRRRQSLEGLRVAQDRLDEIGDLLTRFDLLRDHYTVDVQRLDAIRESGSMFVYVTSIACPVCGASPEAKHVEKGCDGDTETVVASAIAEIVKIERLLAELRTTESDLRSEQAELSQSVDDRVVTHDEIERAIHEAIEPELNDAKASFADLVEKRSQVSETLGLFWRLDKLEAKKAELEQEDDGSGTVAVRSGIPESTAHSFSTKVSSVLKSWAFPGECQVHFDNASADFVIDGKPRGSSGKGLRAITHAAVNIALLEYCQERNLPHPGFVVLDSPLLAYFKPEGDDDVALTTTDLKDRFYDYLIDHHGINSQIIIIENQHPPEGARDRLRMTVFTGNPAVQRFGLL